MTQKVQAFPAGLLAQLGMVGTGQNPNTLMDSVQGVLELGAYYLAPLLTAASGQLAGATNVGDGSPIITVPAGEVWRVIGISQNKTLEAGANVVVRLNAVIRIPGALNMPVMQTTDTLVAVGDQCNEGIMLPQPHVATPGSTFQCVLQNDLGAATCGIGCRVAFQRLRAGA